MSQTFSESSGQPSARAADSHALERIREALHGLRFGTVSVIVQDGAVVQVERTEKLRLLRREPER
jgi:hypothetical protein